MNHKQLWIYGLAILTFSCAQEKPKETWRDGIVVDEFIYMEAPYPSCHAATIAETPDGMVAAWFGGTHERHSDVGIWLSHLEDGKWSESVEVANGLINDSLRYPTWNPVLFQVPDGDLQLYYKVGPKPSEWWGMMMSSTDGGRSWTHPQVLPDSAVGPVKNKPVLLENGDLIAASSTEGDGWNVHFEISSDLGKSWEVVGPIDRGPDDINAIQPSVLDHGNGKLQILCRTRNRAIASSWSEDYGRTWSPLEKTNLPNNNSGTDAVTLQDGRHLLIYNHVLPPGDEVKGARTPLNLSYSEDGVHWQASLILEDSEISQYSYPAIIQSSDGMIHMVYTWRRERIKYVKVDPEKLTGLPIENGIWPSIIAEEQEQ